MNLNLCAVNPRTRYCEKCDTFVRVGRRCLELSEEFSHYDSDSGDYVWDDDNKQDTSMEEALDYIRED